MFMDYGQEQAGITSGMGKVLKVSNKLRTGTGRKKIAIEPIGDLRKRRVTFTKRRKGLFKKIAKLRELTGCGVFVLAFSTAGKPYMLGDINLAESIGNSGKSSGIGEYSTKSCCGNSELGFGVEGSEVGNVGLNPWVADGSGLQLLEEPIGSMDSQCLVDQFLPLSPLTWEDLEPLQTWAVGEPSLMDFDAINVDYSLF